MKWQPIETAPKVTELILDVWSEKKGYQISMWSSHIQHWVDDDYHYRTNPGPTGSRFLTHRRILMKKVRDNPMGPAGFR